MIYKWHCLWMFYGTTPCCPLPDPETVARPAVSDASFQDVTGDVWSMAAVRRNHGISWVLLWVFLYGISWDILEISGFLWVFDGIFWRYLMMYPLVMTVTVCYWKWPWKKWIYSLVMIQYDPIHYRMGLYYTQSIGDYNILWRSNRGKQNDCYSYCFDGPVEIVSFP